MESHKLNIIVIVEDNPFLESKLPMSYYDYSLIELNTQKKFSGLYSAPKPFGFSFGKSSFQKRIEEKTNTIKSVRDKDMMAINLEIADKLRFPLGQPKVGEIYARCPKDLNTYYPINDYHKAIAEQQINEAINLLMCLGAKTISIELQKEHIKSSQQDLSGNFFDSLDSEFKRDSTRTKRDKFYYSASFDNDHPPYIPDNLYWYHTQPTWKTVAQGRLEYNMTNFEIEVEHHDSFKQDISFDAKAKALNLDLSSLAEKSHSTRTKIMGSF